MCIVGHRRIDKEEEKENNKRIGCVCVCVYDSGTILLNRRIHDSCIGRGIYLYVTVKNRLLSIAITMWLNTKRTSLELYRKYRIFLTGLRHIQYSIR